MTVYILLFLLGFIVAVCMLAYASIQVAELNKKAEEFSKNLRERYSKPIIGLDDKKESKTEKPEKPEKERAENEKKN